MKNTKTKNIEVEIRAWIDDITSFENTIKKLGARSISSSNIYDTYFCVKTATRVEDVEMDKVGSYSLRLRRLKKNGEREYITMNTKTITRHGDHNAWEEHEVEVSNFLETTRILSATEFKPFFTLDKERFVYQIDSMEICIENIAGFGGAVEVEIMCSQDESNKAKKKIRNFLNKCNIDDEKMVPKSITNIIMKERAFKQKISLENPHTH